MSWTDGMHKQDVTSNCVILLLTCFGGEDRDRTLSKTEPKAG